MSGFPFIAFVLCASAFLGPSTGRLLADGTIALRSFQFGGISALELWMPLSALPGPNPVPTLDRHATTNSSNQKEIATRSWGVVQECKPPGAICSLPGECRSNSCLPRLRWTTDVSVGDQFLVPGRNNLESSSRRICT